MAGHHTIYTDYVKVEISLLSVGAVGGKVYPVNRVSILMPWIGLAVALALAGVFGARFARRRVRG